MIRILDVLASGSVADGDTFDPEPIVQSVNGLGANSVSALRDLTGALADS